MLAGSQQEMEQQGEPGRGGDPLWGRCRLIGDLDVLDLVSPG